MPAMWCAHSLFKQNATTFDECIFECVFACVFVPNRMAKRLTTVPSLPHRSETAGDPDDGRSIHERCSAGELSSFHLSSTSGSYSIMLLYLVSYACRLVVVSFSSSLVCLVLLSVQYIFLQSSPFCLLSPPSTCFILAPFPLSSLPSQPSLSPPSPLPPFSLPLSLYSSPSSNISPP